MELADENRKLKRQVLKLKMHMHVLVATPTSKTAQRLKYVHGGGIFSDTIINLN